MFVRTDVDIAVVGGGIIGLFAAAEAAKLGSSVVLLEQHFPGTQEGSSAEHVRMWRTMYTEYNHSRLAYRAGDLYRNVEQTVGMQILHHSGLLNFGVETDSTPEGTLLTPIKTLESIGQRLRDSHSGRDRISLPVPESACQLRWGLPARQCCN
jgi:sarcosine oxidase/L-pipecolate oxidase